MKKEKMIWLESLPTEVKTLKEMPIYAKNVFGYLRHRDGGIDEERFEFENHMYFFDTNANIMKASSIGSKTTLEKAFSYLINNGWIIRIAGKKYMKNEPPRASYYTLLKYPILTVEEFNKRKEFKEKFEESVQLKNTSVQLDENKCTITDNQVVTSVQLDSKCTIDIDTKTETNIDIKTNINKETNIETNKEKNNNTKKEKEMEEKKIEMIMDKLNELSNKIDSLTVVVNGFVNSNKLVNSIESKKELIVENKTTPTVQVNPSTNNNNTAPTIEVSNQVVSKSVLNDMVGKIWNEIDNEVKSLQALKLSVETEMKCVKGNHYSNSLDKFVGWFNQYKSSMSPKQQETTSNKIDFFAKAIQNKIDKVHQYCCQVKENDSKAVLSANTNNSPSETEKALTSAKNTVLGDSKIEDYFDELAVWKDKLLNAPSKEVFSGIAYDYGAWIETTTLTSNQNRRTLLNFMIDCVNASAKVLGNDRLGMKASLANDKEKYSGKDIKIFEMIKSIDSTETTIKQTTPTVEEKIEEPTVEVKAEEPVIEVKITAVPQMTIQEENHQIALQKIPVGEERLKNSTSMEDFTAKVDAFRVWANNLITNNHLTTEDLGLVETAISNARYVVEGRNNTPCVYDADAEDAILDEFLNVDNGVNDFPFS